MRDHVAALHALPAADEENFRLITGFNDIFVTIACALVFASAINVKVDAVPWLGALLVAVASWLLAEVFTRKRRMALPSIVLLGAFVIGAGTCAWIITGQLMTTHEVTGSWEWEGKTHHWSRNELYPWQEALRILGGACAGALCALAHWLRFRVAITIAAGVGALVLLILSTIAALTDEKLFTNLFLAPAALVCGIGVFALAMRWDLSDRERRTQRADIAFWLHLLAAPLLAHPLFYWMGVLGHARLTTLTGLGVLAIYLVFATVALAVDRRALLVSALAYVLAALYALLHRFGSVDLAMALTTLLIGSALLALSIFWARLRRIVLKALPEQWSSRLPGTA